MTASAPDDLTVFATYRVRADQEEAFLALVSRHWPTLRALGLVTDEPPVVYRGADEQGRPYLVEIFTWADAAAVDKAHHAPEVMAIWEPMGELVEERDGTPKFEFPHLRRLDVPLASP